MVKIAVGQKKKKKKNVVRGSHTQELVNLYLISAQCTYYGYATALVAYLSIMVCPTVLFLYIIL